MIIRLSNSLNYFIYTIFFMSSIFGLVRLDGYNYLNVTLILECFLIFSTVIAILGSPFKSQDLSILLAGVVSLGYVAFSAIISLIFGGDNILDFLREYKVFIYILFLSMFVNYPMFSFKMTKSIFQFLIFAFIVKYSISVFLLEVHRPGIFTENNFELCLLLLLFLALSDKFGTNKNIYFVLLSFIVIISGSRSGMASLLCIYFASYNHKFDIYLLLKVLVGLALIIYSLNLVMSRISDDVISTDRIRFLMVFFNEIREWGVLNYLFGTMPITPLQPVNCDQLSYYNSLNSFSGDGSCYSVILHSFILRVVFVHGGVGLVALIWFYWSIFRHLKVSRRKIIGFFGVVFCSSLSISSINSVYFIIGTLFLMSSQKWRSKEYLIGNNLSFPSQHSRNNI
jgi:hypothetical protein